MSLPTWNLRDLYKSPKDKQIQADLEQASKRAKRFGKRYRGTLLEVTKKPKAFRPILEEYAEIYTILAKPSIYAGLRFAETSAEPSRGAFVQQVRAAYTDISKELFFFNLEIQDLPNSRIKKLLAAKALTDFQNYLYQVSIGKRHSLTEELERLTADKSLTGRSAFIRLFDEEMGAARYLTKIPGKKQKSMSQTEVLDLLHSSDGKKRKAGAVAISRGLKENIRRTTYIYNTLIQDKAINDTYRSYRNPEDSRHQANQISHDMVDALCDAVTETYSVVQNYYRFKKKVIGVRTLYDYDRYAPIGAKEIKISYPKAKKLILDSFEKFSPEFADVARLFFDKNWIDAQKRVGKRGGAFCQMGTPQAHPYVFINYSGTMRDVFTLAHELGHGIHGYLMRENNYLNYDVPLTVCETASVFSEMLLFEHLKSTGRSGEELFGLTMHKIESIFATVYRQISMFLFERDVHAARKAGELLPDTISQLWMKRQKEMFRSSITFTPGYEFWWSYIPHFIHTPFYVYAYAYGELLTLALYQQYKSSGKTYPTKFMQLLSEGGSKKPTDLLKPFRINMRKKTFWLMGIDAIEELLTDAKDRWRSL